MTLEKNGVDLSLNLMAPSVMRRVETALQNYLRNKTLAPKGASASEAFEHYCREIFAFVDEIYGKGMHERIFGEETGYDEVTSLYFEITNAMLDVRIQMEQMQLEQAQAQSTRRAKIAELEAEQTRLAEANEAALQADSDKLAARYAEMQKERAAQQRDTSAPFSDMSTRPRMPLAVPQSSGEHTHTISLNERPMHSHSITNMTGLQYPGIGE